MGKASNNFFASPWDDLKYQDDSVSLRSSTVAASEIVARKVRKFEQEVAMTSETSTTITLHINVTNRMESSRNAPSTDRKDRELSENVPKNLVQSSHTRKQKREFTQKTTDKHYSKREIFSTQRFRQDKNIKQFKCKRRLVYALLSTVIALIVIVGIWVTIYVYLNQMPEFDPPVATTTDVSATTTDTTSSGPTHFPPTVTEPPTLPTPFPPTVTEPPTADSTSTRPPTPFPTTVTYEAITTSTKSSVAPSTEAPSSNKPISSELPISIAFACTLVIFFIVVYIWIAIYIKYKEETFFHGDSKNTNASNQVNAVTVLSNKLFYISDFPTKLNSFT